MVAKIGQVIGWSEREILEMPIPKALAYYDEAIRLEHEALLNQIKTSNYYELSEEDRNKLMSRIQNVLMSKDQRENFYDTQWEQIKKDHGTKA